MTAAPILVVTGPSGVGKTTVSRLVAAAFAESVHIRIDDFTPFVVNGWIAPWLPEAAHQNRILGGAVVASALQFAQGGYTVVIDGNVFPDALEELARAFGATVPLHYAVLRCDLGTCWERAHRDPEAHLDIEGFAQLHAKFDDLGAHARYAVDAGGAPDAVAAALLDGFRSGRLAARAGDHASPPSS